MKTDDRLQALRDNLLAQAIGHGLCREGTTGDEANAAIEALLERDVRVPTPTEEECRRWYDANPRAFMAGEIVFARHILFAVTPNTPVSALRHRAEETLLEVRAHPELFSDRARELSNCSTGATGGALGQLTRGDCTPEFEAAIFEEVGCGVLPALVRTRHGFHVVMIHRRVPGQRVAFEAVRGEIASRLARAALLRALAQYAQALEQA